MLTGRDLLSVCLLLEGHSYSVNTTVVALAEVERRLLGSAHNFSPGGHWSPRDCTPRWRVSSSTGCVCVASVQCACLCQFYNTLIPPAICLPHACLYRWPLWFPSETDMSIFPFSFTTSSPCCRARGFSLPFTLLSRFTTSSCLPLSLLVLIYLIPHQHNYQAITITCISTLLLIC